MIDATENGRVPGQAGETPADLGGPGPMGTPPQAPSTGAPTTPPLNVSGVVVTKADLVAALRSYVPLLVDITPLDGGRFLLGFVPSG